LNIAAWLGELGLERYAEAFEANDIDASVLRTLNADDLKELGVTSLGHRKKLLEAIAALTPQSSAAPVAAAPAPASATPAVREAERRQLTVMFCDLVGSTGLAARLDPEDMGRVIRAYQDCCAEVVRRWDGHVAKFMGDGVLAYFGWPQAHEDDAERAVRAGLDMAAAVGRLQARDDEPLAARVGIATGVVMVGELIGDGAAQEQAVVGETPNLAARLQALAAPGAVAISQSTRRLLGGLFELDDLGPQRLKGFAEPLAAWRVAGEGRAEGRFQALRGEHLTPLVGREHELALLLERWAWAREGDGQVVLISGEPGIGKSRLLQALRQELSGQPHLALSHFGSAYHTNSALHPIIAQLERAAGFAVDDQPPARLAKLEALLCQSTDQLEDAVPLVGALLGIPANDRYPALNLSPQRQKQRTLEVLIEQLAGLARRRPVLELYEDLHWVDPSTLELLDLLVERVRPLPVLVVATFRPEFTPPWSGQAHVTTLPLNRLGRRQGATMALRVTGGKPLPNQILDQIVARTDGVPLFVEELTKTVLESGLLTDTGDRYELTGPLPPLAIPATLQDSLTARLDRLALAKETAQVGAVIGREFSHELLASVADRSKEQLQSALDQLVASELVFRRGVPPVVTYSFKHALVQDTAYQSLLKSKRQQLHARIAQSLEERFPDRVHSEPEVLAHHYAEADLVARAIPYWLGAGRKAAERSADREAAAHLRKGLELVAQLPDPRERAEKELDLRIALGPVLMNIRGTAAPEVAEVYERAHELCGEVGGPEQTFPVLWGLWFHHYMSGQLRVAGEYANELIGVARGLPDTVFRLQGQHAAWMTRCALGELAVAQGHVEEGLGLYDLDRHASSAFVYGGHDAGVCGYSNGALICWLLGYSDRALHLAEDGVALARRLDQPFSSAQALCLKAMLHQLRGEPRAVAEGADELLALCVKHDLKAWARNAEMLKAWTLLGNALVDEGLRQFRQALDARRATGVTARQEYYLVLLAEALGCAGRPEPGLEAVTEALELIQSTEDRRWEALGHRVRGDLLLAASGRNDADAEAAFRCAIDVARTQEAKSLELRAATSLARLLADQDERQSARDLLAPVYGWFTEGFDTADLKDAKALLDALG
jgi:predicted ATPase/class 3 adenylate cyclase